MLYSFHLGDDLIRLRKPQHTHNPSIQGTWTPFTNKPSELNVTVFPDKKLSEAYRFKKSATEILQEAADKHRANAVRSSEDR